MSVPRSGTAVPPGRHQSAGGGGSTGLTLLASTLGVFMALLDVTVVNVALPTIRTDLSASLTDLEWIANAYLLALAVFIVTAGRLGDLAGSRRMYVLGLAVFVVGSAVCAASSELSPFGLSNVTVLHAGRVVQGIGGAAILPLSLVIIYQAFGPERRRVGIAIWGVVGGVATATGPLVGGLLVDHVSWQSIFLINLPIGLVAIAVALRGVATTRAPGRGGLDPAGLLVISVLLLCLNLALVQGHDWGWTSGRVLGLFAAALVALVVLLPVEARSANPILPPAMFRQRAFAGIIVVGFLLGTGVFAMIFYLSLYLQQGLGFSALGTGTRLLPLTMMLVVGAPVGGKAVAKVGARKVVTAGLALMAVGLLLLTRLDPTGGKDSWTALLPGMLLAGFALGLVFATVSELTVTAARTEQTGVASSLGVMFRQVGNAVGIAVMGAFLSSTIAGVAGDPSRAASAVGDATTQMAWFAAVAVAVAAVVAALVLGQVGAPPTGVPLAEGVPPAARHAADPDRPAYSPQGYADQGQGYAPQGQGYAPQGQGYADQGRPQGHAPQAYDQGQAQGYTEQGQAQGYAPQGYADQGQPQGHAPQAYDQGQAQGYAEQPRGYVPQGYGQPGYGEQPGGRA